MYLRDKHIRHYPSLNINDQRLKPLNVYRVFHYLNSFYTTILVIFEIGENGVRSLVASELRREKEVVTAPLPNARQQICVLRVLGDDFLNVYLSRC